MTKCNPFVDFFFHASFGDGIIALILYCFVNFLDIDVKFPDVKKKVSGCLLQMYDVNFVHVPLYYDLV